MHAGPAVAAPRRRVREDGAAVVARVVHLLYVRSRRRLLPEMSPRVVRERCAAAAGVRCGLPLCEAHRLQLYATEAMLQAFSNESSVICGRADSVSAAAMPALA